MEYNSKREFRQEIKELKSKNKKLRKRNKKLQNDKRKLSQSISFLKSEVRELKKLHNRLWKKYDTLSDHIDDFPAEEGDSLEEFFDSYLYCSSARYEFLRYTLKVEKKQPHEKEYDFYAYDGNALSLKHIYRRRSRDLYKIMSFKLFKKFMYGEICFCKNYQ